MQRKKKVILMLTEECNSKSRCKYCYISPFGKFHPKEAAKMTEKLVKSGYSVSPTGAEVLLNPEYLECYRIAGQRYILSNGILLSKKGPVFDRMKECGIEEVRLSYNFGLSSDIWYVPSKTVECAISLLLAEGFRVSIAALVTSDNYLSVSDQCKKAEELGASEITFFRYLNVGGSKFEGAHILPDSLVPHYFRLVEEARSKGAIKISHNLGFGPTQRLKKILERIKTDFCPAGKLLFAITPDNKIYGCPALIRPGLEIGVFSENDLHITKEMQMQRDTCAANSASIKLNP
jgi:MoaA/NifB/PqqE/SkfB family radical SAM enzyme